MLIALLEKAEGITLIAGMLAKLSTPGTVTLVVALLTGAISVYSSTSGVVLPAFLPMVPTIARQLGGANAVAIAMSMNVGGHLVDVSPLSTIGALCIAAVHGDDSRRTVQSAARVGAVDDHCWRVDLLPGVRAIRIDMTTQNAKHTALADSA